jgi:hypothetical protein
MLTSFVRQHHRLSWVLGACALILVIALLVAIFLVSRAFAMPPQPLPFKHSVHVQAGVTCLYCHPGAQDGPVAGLPSLAKCMGCHANVQPKNPADQADIDKLLKQWESQQPVDWVQVTQMPDFVHFNHRPHIAAGVACESCHGNVSEMGYAQAYNLNMGFCLSCHRKQAPEKVARLIDCSTCHY